MASYLLRLAISWWKFWCKHCDWWLYAINAWVHKEKKVQCQYHNQHFACGYFESKVVFLSYPWCYLYDCGLMQLGYWYCLLYIAPSLLYIIFLPAHVLYDEVLLLIEHPWDQLSNVIIEKHDLNSETLLKWTVMDILIMYCFSPAIIKP